MAKQNSFLLQLQAKADARAADKVKVHVEIDTMALLLAAHEALQVGPGRADKLLNAYLAWKLDIAEEIVKELDEDLSKTKELIVVKRDLAKRLKDILGPAGWEKAKTLFPFLREYW